MSGGAQMDRAEQAALRAGLSAYPVTPADSPLQVVRFLRAHPTAAAGLAALTAAHRIVPRLHVALPRLVQLRYAPGAVDHPIVRESRGLILDASRSWAPVAMAFTRFFNDKPGVPCDLDWGSARAYEKLDGSMAILYHHGGRWRVASSRRPDASGVLGSRGFRAHFWETWAAQGMALPDDPGWCYAFELLSREHTIVVQHDQDALRLIGARDMRTLQEAWPEPIAAAHGWPCVPRLTLWGEREADRRAAVRRHVAGLDGTRQEGVIVCDGAFRRLKFKSPGYLARHWRFPLRGTGRRLPRQKYLEVICAREVDEFLAICPLQRPFVAEAQAALGALEAQIDAELAALGAAGPMRAFAEAVRKRPHAAILFRRRKQPDTATRALLLQCTPAQLDRMLRENTL